MIFNIIQESQDYSVINPNEVVEYKSYWDNGQPLGHSFYVNGNIHGESKTYYNNGQLCCCCFYVNSKIHGEYKSYYVNGQLDEHYFFVNGEVFEVDHLKDGSYKSKCILITLFDGNVIDEDI